MHKKITIYSTPNCPHCVSAKRYFKSLGIPFKDYDVSKDRKAAENMVKKTGQMGVPVIEIGNQIIIGFNKGRIENMLEGR
ncbi:MAG TPA: glutaredoxin family protein [Thermotogota bacterium]|nr:glutaredoxin family protein [Thermotogota bacterium]HPJ87593.1 glutaredoxin family protein [Thermotogota bacterium]HPR94798.1 glutaredoxin family protein [Thermotogota bacterium]